MVEGQLRDSTRSTIKVQTYISGNPPKSDGADETEDVSRILVWGTPRTTGRGGHMKIASIRTQSSLEPLEQSVLNTLLVARPSEEITKKISDWEPVAHPVPDTTLDGRLMEGTTYLEHSALGVSLDSGLMEGMSGLEPLDQSVLNTMSAALPEEGITELSDREPVVLPVLDITLDGRPMEGTTYLEHSALGVSLDSQSADRTAGGPQM